MGRRRLAEAASAEKKKFRCEMLSWARVVRDSKGLAARIRASGFAPEIVVAIGRGGYVPARLLCDYLHIKDLTTVKVEHWGIAATPDEKAVIRYPLCTDIGGKRVLLVDDITDTGDTLGITMEYLRGLGPSDLRSAVLMHKTSSKFVPDYYVGKVTQWRWIIFPWHIREDLTHFIRGIISEGGGSVEEVQRALRDKYSLEVKSDTVREILAEVG